VALALVHRGERVEVANDHRQRTARARGALEFHVEQLLEGAAVQQPGEGIRSSRVGDASPQFRHATALVQGNTRQRESAGVWEERSEGSDRLHVPLVIDRPSASLERVTPKIKRP
jgi:hypothetical protein